MSSRTVRRIKPCDKVNNRKQDPRENHAKRQDSHYHVNPWLPLMSDRVKHGHRMYPPSQPPLNHESDTCKYRPNYLDYFQCLHGARSGLTSRAQARGTNQRKPRSGTGTAIPRCLQRFVRLFFHHLILVTISPISAISAHPLLAISATVWRFGRAWLGPTGNNS